MGVINESEFRPLSPNAKEKLNRLLVDIFRYMNSVKTTYNMSSKDIATCIYQSRMQFPYASCFLMLYLLDDYCVSQTIYNSVILQEIYMFLSAHYDKVDNCYKDMDILEPEMFVVTAIMSYEFLAFMKEFFVLDESFNPYFDRLGASVPDL